MRYIIIFSIVTLSPLFAHAAEDSRFAEMLQDVLHNHPAVQAEEAALEATREGASEAASGFFPSVVAGYDKGRRKVRYNQLSPQYEDVNNKEIVVTQPIFNGGETIAQMGAADARSQAGEARLRLTKQQVLFNAIRAYVDVVEKQEVLQLVQENMDVLTLHLEGAKTQFSEGDLTITDIAQSKARLARANAELHDVSAALASAYATYKREVGQDPAVVHLPPLPEGVPQSKEAVLALLDVHPAIIEAQQHEQAAEHTVDTRFAALLPDVTLQGLMRDQETSSTPSINSADDRSLMLQVSVPLYQSGAEYARLRQARHQRTQAHSQVVDVSRSVRERMLRGWHDFQAAGDVIESHQQAMAAAEEALRAVRIEQVEGTRTVQDVLNLQEEYYTNRINLTRAEARHVAAAYRLLAVMGVLDRAMQ